MIHWKISVLSVALGAAATAGFVWLGRRPPKVARPDVGPTLDTADAPQPGVEQFDAEEAARADAFHDFGLADRADRQDGREEIAELLDAIEVEPFDVGPIDADNEPVDTELEISSLDEEALSDGERYDAVDPERLGNEFLSRAIEAPAVSPPVREPFAPSPDEGYAARIERLDHAVEVPVGRIDSNGNVEFHEPHPTPTQSAVELPLTEEELERRRVAEAERNG